MNDDLPLFADEEIPVYSVSEITDVIRAVIEDNLAGEIAVRGEISNFKRHTSKHIYFSLKDENAVLRCVYFYPENSRLTFMPADGMAVVARGELGVYGPQGTYQLYVTSLVPQGEGALWAALERLRRKLAAEGLFDESRKRPLPRFPQVVGVVTSAAGAAWRDIKNVLSRRWPGITIVLCPAKVQGAGAAEDIAAALRALDAAGVADVLIVGRGGGSLEDLWAFNEEVAVRAIAAARTPVISAVGHEVDWTLADLAADVRAPTPSAAAELAVPSKTEVAREVSNLKNTLFRAARAWLDDARGEVTALATDAAFRAVPRRVTERAQLVDETLARAARAVRNAVAAKRATFATVDAAFRSLSPRRTLERGFNLASRRGILVKRAADAQPGDRVMLTFADGKRGAVIAPGPEGGPDAQKTKTDL